MRKSSFKNNKPVKKKVDSFAIASIVSLFGTLLIGSSIALATFFLGLSLVFGLISIIRISQKPQERGGAVFAVLGILLGIIILVAIKKTFR